MNALFFIALLPPNSIMEMVSLHNLNTAVEVALALLNLVGFWGTWGIGARTSFLEMIKRRLIEDTKLLLSVGKPLEQSSTPIAPVEALIRKLKVFLWPAIDGRWPELALIAWEFSGRFLRDLDDS